LILQHSPLENAAFFFHDDRTLETPTLVGVYSCPDPAHCHSTGDGVMLQISAHVDISSTVLHLLHFLHLHSVYNVTILFSLRII